MNAFDMKLYAKTKNNNEIPRHQKKLHYGMP